MEGEKWYFCFHFPSLISVVYQSVCPSLAEGTSPLWGISSHVTSSGETTNNKHQWLLFSVYLFIWLSQQLTFTYSFTLHRLGVSKLLSSVLMLHWFHLWRTRSGCQMCVWDKTKDLLIFDLYLSACRSHYSKWGCPPEHIKKKVIRSLLSRFKASAQSKYKAVWRWSMLPHLKSFEKRSHLLVNAGGSAK